MKGYPLEGIEDFHVRLPRIYSVFPRFYIKISIYINLYFRFYTATTDFQFFMIDLSFTYPLLNLNILSELSPRYRIVYKDQE